MPSSLRHSSTPAWMLLFQPLLPPSMPRIYIPPSRVMFEGGKAKGTAAEPRTALTRISSVSRSLSTIGQSSPVWASTEETMTRFFSDLLFKTVSKVSFNGELSSKPYSLKIPCNGSHEGHIFHTLLLDMLCHRSTRSFEPYFYSPFA